MTNAELSAAIEWVYKMLQITGPQTEVYQSLLSHLNHLLGVQERRADHD